MSCTEILQNLYLYHVRSASKVKKKKKKEKKLKDFLNFLVLAGLTETPCVICLFCPVVLPLSPFMSVVKGILESKHILDRLVCIRVELDVSKAMT